MESTKKNLPILRQRTLGAFRAVSCKKDEFTWGESGEDVAFFYPERSGKPPRSSNREVYS